MSDNQITIPCRDVEQAAEFYTALLGMQRAGGDLGSVSLIHPQNAFLRLRLSLWDGMALPRGMTQNPRLLVADCDRICDRAWDLGARIVSLPIDGPNGARQMVIEDPDGALLEIVGPAVAQA